jgi:hypothetical protein
MKASDILALLPFKPEDMPKIATSTQEPTRKSLKAFQECIQDQAMAITSTDPTLGFLGLVIPDNRYITLSENQNSFVQPPDPGPTPPNPEGLTAFQITENVRQYGVAREERKTFCEFQIILVSMITNNCPDKYLTALKDPITKFRRCTPLQILQHLWAEYGTISSQDLTANYTAMTAKWNPPTPIEDLFLQLRDGQEFATDGNESISDSQLLRLCYDNVNSTGLFNDALKIWRAKPQANKTYPLFCTYMTAEHEDRMKNQLTSSGAGYSANNVSVITDIVHKQLEHFINQMPIFQQDPEQYPSNNENSDPNTTPPDQANAALTTKDIKELFKTMMSDFKQPNPPNKRRTSTKPLVAQGKDTDGKDITYCWSHGITTNLRHTSASCNRQKEGHKTDATLQNKLSGSAERCKPRD